MSQSDPLQILLTHDHWATHQILDACAKLTAAQFHHPFDIGPGSLHDALTHIAGAIRAWTDTLAHRDPRPRPETDGRRRTPDELRLLLDESYAELAAESRRLPLDQTATRTLRDGATRTFSRAEILTHVATHSMHHRAQCLNMLRHLGVAPLPPSSVTEWTWLGKPQA